MPLPVPLLVRKVIDDVMYEAYSIVKQDGGVVQFKDKRNQDVSLVRVPVNTTDQSFVTHKQWVDRMIEITALNQMIHLKVPVVSYNTVSNTTRMQ